MENSGFTSGREGSTKNKISFIYAGKRGVGLESALTFYETSKKAGFESRLVLSKDNVRRSLVEKIYPEAQFINFASLGEVLAEARRLQGGVAFFTMLSPKMFPLFFIARAKKIFFFHSQYDKSLIEPKSYISDKLLDIFHFIAIRGADLVAVIHPFAFWQIKLRFGKEASILSHPPFSLLPKGFMGEYEKIGLPFEKNSYFLHFGRIDEFAKGTDMLYRAVEGTGIPTVFLGKTGRKLVGKNIAHIERWLSDGQLQCLLEGAKCVVAPYLSASQFSSVAALAFRFKKPVLAPFSPAFENWVEEGKTGWFYTQGDWEDLHEKMCGVADGRLKFSADAIVRKEIGMEEKSVRHMRALLERAIQ